MKGPSRRTRRVRLCSLMKHLRSRNPKRNDDTVLCSRASGTPDPICFPTVRCAACHPQPHQTALVRGFFPRRTNTRQVMRCYANTTQFSSFSFMHWEIMRLLSERAAPHRLIHSGAAALKSLVKQMKTSCSVAPLMGRASCVIASGRYDAWKNFRSIKICHVRVCLIIGIIRPFVLQEVRRDLKLRNVISKRPQKAHVLLCVFEGIKTQCCAYYFEKPNSANRAIQQCPPRQALSFGSKHLRRTTHCEESMKITLYKVQQNCEIVTRTCEKSPELCNSSFFSIITKIIVENFFHSPHTSKPVWFNWPYMSLLLRYSKKI